MKLSTFNLYQYAEPGFFWYEKKDKNTYTDVQWQKKQNWIKQQLQAMDSDIIGFQEVFSVSSLKNLVASVGYPHFEIIETPLTDKDDNSVFIKPVVAIASKIPIGRVEAVKVDQEVKLDLPIKENFGFSRTPIYAEILTQELGSLHIYVAHLKSKRPMVEDEPFADEVAWEERVPESMRRQSRGHIASSLQRGAESTLLYNDITRRLQAIGNQAFVVLGDLNDHESSVVLTALMMKGRIYEIGEIKQKEWPRHVGGLLHDYRLSDAFKLHTPSQTEVRPYTHIYRGKGGVLDYALVSNALNKGNPDHIGYVSDFKVFNQHLESDGVGDHLQSDHGQVCIELKSIQDIDDGSGQHSPPTTPSVHSSGIQTRQDFIDFAGGVFTSDKKYKNWRGADKWENFWAFYFDEGFGYVNSVYGAIPVSELHQRQRHSIEHIIPKSFLHDYLESKNVPRDTRYGATVNPFNFIPAERGLNSARSSFPFDFEDDQVMRPFRIDLNPEAYRTTGLDAENEWVIPSRSRGDIARSILYMLLAYDINELYNRHVNTLVHWAKLDEPQPWELAYNDWVFSRLNIRNPFIDSRENRLSLLNNESLMRSITLRIS